MLFSPNCIEWEIACFGISKAGGVFVPMNPILREGEVEYQVTDAQEETMIVHESVYPVVKSIRDKIGLKKIIIIGKKQPDTYKKIREVEFIESIPRVLSGKILRRELIKREREEMGLA